MKGLSLKQCVEWDLKEYISELLKIPRDKLDRDTNLADFGFDSISLGEFAKVLTTHYKFEITPAVFFGYSTLEKLTDYFLSEHQDAIQGFYGETVVEQPVSHPIPVEVPFSKRQRLNRFRFSDKEIPQRVPEPIAIIGMSGRFPQARDIDEMWAILAAGKNVVQEIPIDRFDWREYYGDPSQDSTKTNCKWSGCIPGVSEFDPLFFEISPREAERMDPRQRHLLQESWKALEDAGYGAHQIKAHKIGMFVGVEEGDYQLLAKDEAVTSNHTAILASRLAYFLNLKGPVMAINTACSSSLVAAHQACTSLRNQECSTCLAAGVNLMLSSKAYIGMSQAGMLSSDGRCFAFDKRANGMVPGEAVAVVVLKCLSQAEEDGDPIHAIIRGSGINYDGKTNGITAPSGLSQRDLLQSVYDQHQIRPEGIDYIVTHGTGTKLGDPVEINALFDTFKRYTKKQGYCALTSTKTNFGHTFAASGLVSIISLVQALCHETIPRSLHCGDENDYIQWKESPFYVNKANKSWPRETGIDRIGAVSAFGMSGTNAHMVLQDYTADRKGGAETVPYFLLALSAKTEKALQEKIKDMIVFLESENSNKQHLSQVSYTLLEGRHHFQYRCAVVVRDKEETVYAWKQVGGKEKLPNLFEGRVARDSTGQKAIQRYAVDLSNQCGAAGKNKDEYKEILYALGDLYCQGYEIPWNKLYSKTKPHRISLPTYPFAKECYWVSVRKKHCDNREINSPNTGENGYQRLLEGVSQSVNQEANKWWNANQIEEQYEGFLALEAWGKLGLLKALQMMNAFPLEYWRRTSQELVKQLKAKPKYTLWSEVSVRILEEEGYLQQVEKEWIATSKMKTKALQKRLANIQREAEGLIKKYPFIKPSLHLLGLCLEALPEILKGKREATQVMFQQGLMELVGKIYQGTSVADYFNNLTALAIQYYIQSKLKSLPENESITILEIGAGTGGTTRFILDVLRAWSDRIKYVYTDISLGFVRHGRKNFGASHPFIIFKEFNVERAAIDQSFRPGTIDIIVGTNVVHATRNLHHTLQNLKGLLKKDAVLILNEMTQFNTFSHLTFGLLDGWWLFEDGHRRIAHSPLISTTGWQNVLAEEGFQDIHVVGNVSPEGIVLSQAVFMAQRDWRDILVVEKGSSNSERVERKTEPPLFEALTEGASSLEKSYKKVEFYLKEVLGEIIGLKRDTIESTRPLVDYGIDSILGQELMQRLGKDFMGLPLTLLMDYPTLGKLTDFLLKYHGDKLPKTIKKNSVSIKKEEEQDENSFSRKTSAALEGRTPSYPPELVPIQPNGHRPASFWVHARSGFAQVYNPLAIALGPDYPLYAFQARGVDGKKRPFSRLEEMATYYIQCMRDVQPSGPYYVGGYSYGGFVALEMARKLQRLGEPVAMVMMLDTPPLSKKVTHFFRKQNQAYELMHWAHHFVNGDSGSETFVELKELEDIPQDLYLDYLTQRIHEKKLLLSEDEIYYRLKSMSHVMDRLLYHMEIYQVRPYSHSEVVYIEAQDGFYGKENTWNLPDIDMGDSTGWWQKRIKNKMKVVECPGSHLTLLEEPSIAIIKKELENILGLPVKVDQ